MRVDDPLRVAGGAARVAHGRGAVLVVDRELARLGVGEQLLVVADPVVVRDVAVAVVHHDDVLHRLELVDQRPQQLQQRAVGEDDLVLRVVGDVGELLGEQADVERVEHAAGAGRGEVELQVARGVPRERADAAVLRHPERVEDARQPPRPLRPLAVRGALDAAAPRGRDRLVGVQPLRALEGIDECERVRLHEPLHGSSSVRAASSAFASLYSPTVTATDIPIPGPDDVQPVANEALDRFLTGHRHRRPVPRAGLRRLAGVGRPAVLERPDRVRDHVRAHRAGHHGRLPPAVHPPRVQGGKGVRGTLARSSARWRSRAR